MTLDPETWRVLSPLLDEALELEGVAREAWLAQLGGDAAALVPLLRDILSHQAATGPADPLGQQHHLMHLATPAAAAPAAFAAGNEVGPYRLLRAVGAGGMGEVWLAERMDGGLKRQVALKLAMVSLRRTVLLQRFERERDILGSLNHPHIARLYDAGVSTDGQPYLALEYVQGQPITDYADAHGLDAHARIALLAQVMDAVQYAHANLVIHRDIKPPNVLVTAEGQALLLDFGIAKLLEPDTAQAHETELTQLGGSALTLRYAAPEQIRAEPISIATDIWALGVLAYELVCGQRPFDSSDRSQLQIDILHSDPVRPSQRQTGVIRQLPAGLARDLDTMLLKALKKAPAERYRTVNAFAEDLSRWTRDEPVLAQPDSHWYRWAKFVGRNRLAVAATATATVAVLGLAVTATVLGLQARAESARATAARDFLLAMFREADPDPARGREVSAKQLLLKGQETVVRTLADKPQLQADLLAGIAEALSNFEDEEAADKARGQVVDIYLRMRQPRAAALALMDQAHIAITVGDADRAEGLLARADQVHPETAGDTEFIARRLVSKGNVAAARGQFAQAHTSFTAALPLVHQAYPPDHAQTVYTERILGELDGHLGHYAQGIERLTKLLALVDGNPSVRAVESLSILDDLAYIEFLAGQYEAAGQRYDEAATRCERLHDPMGLECAYTQARRAENLLLLGRSDLALPAMPLLLKHAFSEQASSMAPHAARIGHRVLAANGQLGKHPELQARLVALARTEGLPPTLKLQLQLVHLRSELMQGRTAQALGELERLSQALPASAKVDPKARGLLGLYRAQALQAQGNPAAALPLLQAAQALYGESLGAEHPMTQLVAVHQARALWALQRSAEGLALIDHALPVLRTAMGSDAPALHAVEQLRAALAAPDAPSPATASQITLLL